MAQIFIDDNGAKHEFPDDATPQEIDAATQSTNSNYRNAASNSNFTIAGNKVSQIPTHNTNPGFNPILDILPFAIPEIRGAQFLSKIPGVRGALTRYGTSIAQNAATAGGINAIKGNDFKEGAIAGGALTAAFDPFFRGANKLRPSNLFRGNLSKDQLAENLQITRGTNTPLGDVVQSPNLKTFLENVLSKVPYSGVQDTMQKNSKDITLKGEYILEDLLGINKPENIEETLNSAITKMSEKNRIKKANLYKEPDRISDQIGLNLELPTFSKKANEVIDALQDTNILKTEPEFKSLLNKLRNYESPTKVVKSSILGEDGKPVVSKIKYPSLKEANILSSHLNDLSERYASTPNVSERNISGVLRNLSTLLKSDIKKSISESGHAGLKKSFDVAEKNYAKNYSPFLEKEVFKFTKGKVDPDLIIDNFIKTGKNTDRANLLNKIMKVLPFDKKNLFAYGYLKRSLDEKGNINPIAFKELTRTRNLGNRQFEALFPNANMRKRVRDYADLVDMNKESFDLLRNPKTGARIADWAPLALGLTGYKLGGIPGAITAATAVPAGGYFLNKYLTSPSVREKLIKQMLNKKDSKINFSSGLSNLPVSVNELINPDDNRNSKGSLSNKIAKSLDLLGNGK